MRHHFRGRKFNLNFTLCTLQSNCCGKLIYDDPVTVLKLLSASHGTTGGLRRGDSVEREISRYFFRAPVKSTASPQQLPMVRRYIHHPLYHQSTRVSARRHPAENRAPWSPDSLKVRVSTRERERGRERTRVFPFSRLIEGNFSSIGGSIVWVEVEQPSVASLIQTHRNISICRGIWLKNVTGLGMQLIDSIFLNIWDNL